MSTVNVKVVRNRGESIENLMRRFKDKVKRHRIIEEFRDRSQFTSNTQKRKAKEKKSLKRIKDSSLLQA
jgi:ribosomal protein S21